MVIETGNLCFPKSLRLRCGRVFVTGAWLTATGIHLLDRLHFGEQIDSAGHLLLGPGLWVQHLADDIKDCQRSFGPMKHPEIHEHEHSKLHTNHPSSILLLFMGYLCFSNKAFSVIIDNYRLFQ